MTKHSYFTENSLCSLETLSSKTNKKLKDTEALRKRRSTMITRMHSSRMRTARSLIISPYLVISHACLPQGATMHAPWQQPRMPPPEQPHMSPPQEQPHTSPWSNHTAPGSNHVCSPGSNHAHLQSNHTCPPPMNRMTDRHL